MASTLNLTALEDYVNVHKDELFVKSAVGAKTLNYIDIMGNVKYKDELIYLNSTAVLADGSECGFTPAGTDVFSPKYIEVKPVKVEKEWCALDFRKKFANYALNVEAGRETMPFEEKISESNVEAVKLAVENLIWKGDSGLSIVGLKQQITEDVSAIAVTKGDTTTATIDAIVAKLPVAALAKGVDVFMSFSTYRSYVQEQNAYGFANRPVIDAAQDTLVYAGDSRVRLIPTIGLEGANIIIAASRDNLVFGTDIEGSDTVYRLWYDEKDDMFRFRIRFNAGMAYKYGDEIVYSNLA